eukprot:scaffold80_cov382-Prasinococcus_capsulatus_cf.AAC.18
MDALVAAVAKVAIIVRGMEMLRVVEKFCAPMLIVMMLLLFAWAMGKAGGLVPVLNATSQLTTSSSGSFWQVPGCAALPVAS